MVELADTQVLGTCAAAYGFESHYPHHAEYHKRDSKFFYDTPHFVFGFTRIRYAETRSWISAL